mgnify:CR=1 FL=1
MLAYNTIVSYSYDLTCYLNTLDTHPIQVFPSLQVKIEGGLIAQVLLAMITEEEVCHLPMILPILVLLYLVILDISSTVTTIDGAIVAFLIHL